MGISIVQRTLNLNRLFISYIQSFKLRFNRAAHPKWLGTTLTPSPALLVYALRSTRLRLRRNMVLHQRACMNARVS